MRNPLLLTLLVVLASTGATAQAAALLPGNVDAGGKLHQASCTSCHDTSMYTRKQRRIKTVEGLIAQVQACNTNLKTNLSNGQMQDLVIYLNETYYKFE